MDKHAHDHAHGGLGSTGDGSWWSLSQWEVVIAAVLAAVLAAYFLSARHSRWRESGLDGRAVLAWALGLAAMFVAASSPFAFLREGSHLGYMAQLELLMSLVPPLLLLGLRPVWRFFLKERRFVGALWRIISVPALTLGIWLAILYAWHLPTLHMLGMHSQVLYTIQLSSYVVAGLLFWWPVIAPAGDEAGMHPLVKLGYLALAQAGAGLLAAILIFYPRVIYAHGPVTEPFGLSALADQKLSGVAMMVVDMMVASTVAGWIVLRALANIDWRESLSLSASYFRRSASRSWRLGAPLAVIPVGCGLILGTAPASQFSGAAPANDTPAGTVPANAASTIIQLTPASSSGVSGTATFTHAGDRVEVELDVRGLPEPGVTYLAHIHQGACASDLDGGADDHAHHHGSADEPDPEIEHPLSPVVRNTEGSGSSTTVIEDATVARFFSGNSELYVNVHAEASGSEGLPDTLACGDLRGLGESSWRE